VRDLPRRLIGRRNFVHRLVYVGVEPLTQWREFFDAVLLQRFEELALGKFNAFNECLHLGVGGLAQLGTDGLQRAMHVVCDCQNVAGKSRNAIQAGVENLALGAFTEILHLGERAQQLVLEFGCFAPGFSHGIGRLGSRSVVSLGGHGFVLAGSWVRHRAQIHPRQYPDPRDIRAPA